MKKFYVCKLCLIVFGALLATQTVFAGGFASGQKGCFDEKLNMTLKPISVGRIAPIVAVCESKKAIVYLVKAMESKNKIQLEKAQSVCEEKTEIGEIKEIYHSFAVPIPKEKKTGVIAAVNLVDDLFGKSYFALTLGCQEESEAHRIKRENQDKVAKICRENGEACHMILAEDIRKSKRLKELRAEPGDIVFNNKFLKSDDLKGVVERLSRLELEGGQSGSNENIKEDVREPLHSEILASERAAASVLDAMTTRITRAWRRPVAFKGGLEVYLRLSLNPDGDLVDVRVVRISGDKLFDRSAVTAVKRAAPFREIQQFDKVTFDEKFKSLTVKFRPED